MPIYLLGSRTPSVEIPSETVSISIAGSVAGTSLYVTSVEPHRVVRINPHLVIVPRIASELTVGVEPVGATTFGHGTVVHLSVGLDSPRELDPVQVGFDSVNVSGRGATELAALSPRGDRVEVSVRTAADTPLSPLASMARTAARRGAGAGPYAENGSLCVGVDMSASMRSAFADGSVSAAIDMLIGVADTTGIRECTAVLIGESGTPVQAPPQELARAVSRAPTRWSVGARWSALAGAEHTIVVSDFVSRSIPFATVCISDNVRLRPVTPLLSPPPHGVTAEEHLSSHPALIDEFAAAVLPILS